MYVSIRIGLKLKTTYGELRKLYDETHTEISPEKYDIFEDIKNLDIPTASEYLRDKAKTIQKLQSQMANAPKEIKISDLKIIFGHKSGFDNFTLHLENLSVYNNYQKSFAKQNELEDKLINGTYDVKECTEFLCEIMDKKVPYLRTLKFILILFITNKIEMNKLFSLKKLSRETISYIKKGFIQMYGYFEILTLNNIENIIDNISKWEEELKDNDIVGIVTKWKNNEFEPISISIKKTPELIELYASII